MKQLGVILFSLLLLGSAWAQSGSGRWQQRIKYTMQAKMDVQKNQLKGSQVIDYWNNSPDTLTRLFFHMQWNAFQPGSMMDVRSRRQGEIKNNGRPDWDQRVKDRIVNLKPDEIGYQRFSSLKINGVAQQVIDHETVWEVKLSKPILPKSKVQIVTAFDAQVPVQIRRSGRDNAEGVRYSMSQWYPKLAEYDEEGWHPTPYVAREFYGVWGDFDVKLTIDKSYTVGGTGYLQNPQQIGHGYEIPGTKVVAPAGKELTWHFIAPNVHDFMWAADPEFVHLSKKTSRGIVLHVFHKKGQNEAAWANVLTAADKVLPFIEQHFGPYPYQQYSFIQGGDGGMEYPMATLLKGPGLGTVFHEWMHSWYQMMLGTNEGQHPWMDEGFTSFAESEISAWYEKATNQAVTGNGVSTGPQKEAGIVYENVHSDGYAAYFNLVKSGKEEPLTTHADHYNTNFAYSVASYAKGEVFLTQLGYIIGDSLRNKTLLNYYWKWRFKHPTPQDFIRVAENTSGIQLDWYKQYFVHTTKTIDYGIDSLWEKENQTLIRLKQIGLMPMPIDVCLTFKDGSKEWHYIPQYAMFGAKPNEWPGAAVTVEKAWKWTHPTYEFSSQRKLNELVKIEIDPTGRLADVDKRNNKLELKW